MKNYDKAIGMLFMLLTISFLILLFTNQVFLHWVFARHQNQLSWFIRPLFIVPFCYFAFRRSWAGIWVTVFCMLTSMFWFNQPAIVSEDVKAFLEFEIEWISGKWNPKKLLFALLAPFSFILLGLAFWGRSIWFGIAVIILMAFGKMTWGIYQAGQSGKSMIVPALIGLFICAGSVYYGFKRLQRKP